MSFNNSGYIPPINYGNLAYNINSAPRPVPRQAPRPVPAPAPVPLNSSMVERVHKAKPGCSACGKKVA